MRDELSVRALVAGGLAWLIPGAGHLLQGMLWRGVLLGGVVCLMFVAGLLMGGHLFGFHNVGESGVLAYIFGFCNLGTGLIYVSSVFLDVGLLEQAKRATSEYGNVFLMVAGLLNYLISLDAYDIAARRKS